MSIAALLILKSIDDLIKKINELIAVMTGVPLEDVEIVVPPPTVVITEPKRNNRYHIFTLDTATARADVALGVKEMLTKQGVEFGTYMVVIAVGGGFSYKINSKAAPSVIAQVGAEWNEFEIEEIYITNAAVAGTATIHIEYRVE